MADVVCAHCGKNHGFYKEVDVTGTGWKDAKVTILDDGSLDIRIDPAIQDIDWDRSGAVEMDYWCAECGHHSHNPEAVIKVAGEAKDPIAWRQKNPMVGQVAFDV